MLFPVKAPGKTNPRIDFDYHQFQIQIHSMGWRLNWEQAEACPCKEQIDSDSGRLGCPVCDGRGWAWHSAQEVRGLVTRAQQIIDVAPLQKFGDWGHGSINLTLEPEHLPGVYDRFTAVETVFLMREITTRGSASIDKLRYPVAKRVLDLLTGAVTVGVLRCRAQGPDGAALNTTLAEGVDFAVTVDGNIDWALGIGLGSAPAAGRRVFYSYTAHPMFEAIADAYSARDTRNKLKKAVEYEASMPVLVECKLKYGNVRLA